MPGLIDIPLSLLPVRRGVHAGQAVRSKQAAAAAPGRMEGHAQDIVHLLNEGWWVLLLSFDHAVLLSALAGRWRVPRPAPPWPAGLPSANLRLAHALRRFGQLPAGGDAGGSDDEPEVVPPLPPLRCGRHPAQQAGAARQRDADGSPTTSSSHGSGTGTGSASGSQASGGGLPRATLPQPIGSVRQAQQAAAVQDLPGIGTWAGRYRLFGRDAPGAGAQAAAVAQQAAQPPAVAEQAVQPDSARTREAEEARDFFGSPVVLRAGGFDQPAPAGRRSGGGSYGSEQAREDAWRWRFSRCACLAREAAHANAAPRAGCVRWAECHGQARACARSRRPRLGYPVCRGCPLRSSAARVRRSSVYCRKWASEQKKFYEGEGDPGSMASDDLDPLAFTQVRGRHMR